MFVRSLRWVLLLGLWGLGGLAGAATQDKDGGRDHALLPRVPNFYISAYKHLEFETEEFNVGGGRRAKVEGRLYRLEYSVEQGSGPDIVSPGRTQVFRHQAAALQAAGGRVLAQESHEQVWLVERGGRETWFEISVGNEDAKWFRVNIVEKGPMRQDLPTTGKSSRQDKPGSRDPALFGRMPEFYISGYKVIALGEFEFDVGGGRRAKIEGRKTELEYSLEDNYRPDMQRPGRLQIIRNYQAAFKAAGGRVLNDPGHETTLLLEKGPAQLWVEVSVGNEAPGWFRVTMVEKGEMSFDIAPPPPAPVPAVVPAAPPPAELKPLVDTGRVALYIQFDQNQASIRPESSGILDQIAAMLQSQPTLRLAIEGHTDGTGDRRKAMALSRARAKAVLDALVGRGIDAGRLSSAGFGPDRPIADNATPEGQARNRRVELVRQ